MALLRHGEAATGDAGAGRVLTGRGRRQARAAGRWLAPLRLARVLATATERAQETARLLAIATEQAQGTAWLPATASEQAGEATPPPAAVIGREDAAGRPRLGQHLEAAPGMEGLRIGGAETPLRGVAGLSIPYEDPEHRPPGGESLVDLRERASRGLAEVAAGTGPAAIVAHRFVCNVLVAAALGVELSRADALLQDPCAINLYALGNPHGRRDENAPSGSEIVPSSEGVGGVAERGGVAEAHLLTVNASAADPLRLGPDGRRLPDTETAVERRRYLLAVEDGTEAPAPPRRQRSSAAAPPSPAGPPAATRRASAGESPAAATRRASPDEPPPAATRRASAGEPPAAIGLRGAARLLGPEIEARVELLPPAELAAAVADAAALGPAAAERIPAPPGSVAILDEAAGRTWVRCLGWNPAAPARLAVS